MDLEPSDDDLALTGELRRFLDDRAAPEARRAAAELPGAVDRDLWRGLGELGVFGVAAPAEGGGLDLGFAPAVLVAEELGRAAVPGPVVGTLVAAALLPGPSGSADGPGVVDVAGIVDGGCAVGVVDAAAPALVEHLAGLGLLVVLDPDGVRLVDPATVEGTPLARPVDPLTPIDRVARLDGGESAGGVAVADRWRLVGALVTAAVQVGLGEGALRMATAYAGERQQFGRPIGTFQALKHLLADALCALEVARSAVWSAAVTLDEAPPGPSPAGGAEAARAVAGARLLASSSAARSTRTCVQVHGGMGYTWELDAHLYLKRALVLDTTFGSVDAAVDAVAASL